MGALWDLWKIARDVIAGPQTAPTPLVPPRTAAPLQEPVQLNAAASNPVLPPRPVITAHKLAKELFAEFPDDIDTDILWTRSEAAGLDVQTVDRELDLLRYAAEEKAQAIVRKIKPASLRIMDLAPLDSVRVRVKGSAFSVTSREREKFSGTEYLLVPEPDNAADIHAIAVYGKGRRVGYAPATRAASLTPLLAQLEADAFRVTGTGTGEQGSRLWVDLPKAEALRAFLKKAR